ncbi:MAG: hypothetical protein AB7V13_24685 [Pseudorhodoplanes sp.]
MMLAHAMTAHARERSAERSIPPMIAEMIIDFGESCDAGNGARKYGLTRDSMRLLRRAAGREIAKVVDRYRSRNAYVVAANGCIVTLAYASRPIIFEG